MSFDILGRVTASKQTTDGVIYGDGVATSPMIYTYNLSGAMVEQQYPSGRVVKNTLDADGSLSQVQSRTANDTFKNYANSFVYNAAGAVSAMRLGNGRWENTQFNERLQPIMIGLGSGATSQNLLKLNYDYGTTENNGNVKSQTITVNRTGQSPLVFDQTYTYDSLNRITSAEEKTGTATNWMQAYTFDRYGNRNFDEANTTTITKNCGTAPNFVVCTADIPVVNPVASTSTNRLNDYTYDAAGNVIEDAEGRTFTYDAENKQVEVENSLSQLVGQYFFDGDGKRIKKVVPSTGEVTIFVYDAGAKLIGEYSTVIETQNPKVQYLTADHLGSPRINTDQFGQVVSRTDYMPYGEEIIGLGGRTSSNKYVADDVRQGFTGYENDTETGLDFAQARYASSTFGRFTSVDPMKMSLSRMTDPQQINLYGYAKNNPLKFIDSNGEDIELAAGLTKVDADRIVKLLAAQYMTPKGRQSLEALEKSDIIYRYGVASLGQERDANGNPVAEIFAQVIPEVTSFQSNAAVDQNGNLAAIKREGLVVLINFDFNKIDSGNPVFPNGQSATDQNIANHELGHEMDTENYGPFYHQTTPGSIQEPSAESFRLALENEIPIGRSPDVAKKRVTEMLASPKSPQTITCRSSKTGSNAVCMNELLQNTQLY